LKRFHLSGERSAECVSIDDGALRGKPCSALSIRFKLDDRFQPRRSKSETNDAAQQ